jgi:hypothetical protein
MKSITKYLNENVGILIPAKLPHWQTQDRIEDEKLSQMTSKERLEYLSKKEKDQSDKFKKFVYYGVPTIAAASIGSSLGIAHLAKKYGHD